MRSAVPPNLKYCRGWREGYALRDHACLAFLETWTLDEL